MEEKYLTEAFKQLNILNEEVFNLSTDGAEQLKDAEISDPSSEQSDNIQIVIDPSADTMDELEPSYVGKVILSCSVCDSKLYKDPKDIKLGLEGEEPLVNVGEECPYCQSPNGYEIIGQVSEYKPEDISNEEPKIEISDKDKLKDSDMDESLKEAKKSDVLYDPDLSEYQKWVDYDMKKYGKVSSITNEKLKKAELEIVKDDHGDYEVIAKRPNTSMKEDLSKVEIETDKEKIKIESEPKCNCEQKKSEYIAPISSETKEVIKNNSEDEDADDYEEIEFDDIDEKSFDNLGESYLKKEYDNVKSYKTTDISTVGNSLKIEGLITFKSGKKGKTDFIFESVSCSDDRYKFSGKNKQLARGNKSFKLEAKAKGKKLIAESLTYNYRTKDMKNGNSKRIYGRCGK